MIRWTRTVPIAVAKNQEIIRWALELKEYFDSKEEDRKGNTKIFMEILGDTGKICWMMDFDNMAELMDAGNGIESDPGYQERVKALEGLILPGTVDKVYQQIG